MTTRREFLPIREQPIVAQYKALDGSIHAQLHADDSLDFIDANKYSEVLTKHGLEFRLSRHGYRLRRAEERAERARIRFAAFTALELQKGSPCP